MASALFGGLKAAVTAVSVSMATMPAEQISTTGSAFRVVGAKRNRCLIAKTSAIKTTVLQHRNSGPRRTASNAPSDSVITTRATPNRTSARKNRSRMPSPWRAAINPPKTVSNRQRVIGSFWPRTTRTKLLFTTADRFRASVLEPLPLGRKTPLRRRGANRASSQGGSRALALVFRDRLPNFGHEIARNIHDGLGRLNAGLVLR